jgi:hypothetical protein
MKKVINKFEINKNEIKNFFFEIKINFKLLKY